MKKLSIAIAFFTVDGKQWSAHIYLDADKLAKQVGPKAVKTKSRNSRLAYGSVRVHAVPMFTEPGPPTLATRSG